MKPLSEQLSELSDRVKKAELFVARADAAEQDEAYAVAFAISTLDQAEYAIADAVIARADAAPLMRGITEIVGAFRLRGLNQIARNAPI
jgi:hypothetical protein